MKTTLKLNSVCIMLDFVNIVLRVIVAISVNVLLFTRGGVNLILVFTFTTLKFVMDVIACTIATRLNINGVIGTVVSTVLVPIVACLFTGGSVTGNAVTWHGGWCRG